VEIPYLGLMFDTKLLQYHNKIGVHKFFGDFEINSVKNARKESMKVGQRPPSCE
jgi:hypothetical protein